MEITQPVTSLCIMTFERFINLISSQNITYKYPGLDVNRSFKNSLMIHEQNTKKIIAVKESLYVIKHTLIFTKLLPRFSRLIQHLCLKFFRKQSDKMGIKCTVF